MATGDQMYEYEVTDEEMMEVDDLTASQAQLGSSGRRDRLRELSQKMKNHIFELRLALAKELTKKVTKKSAATQEA